MREYPEQHDQGIITLENIPEKPFIKGDLGIQVSPSGKVWICIDGVCLLRFAPMSNLVHYLREGE